MKARPVHILLVEDNDDHAELIRIQLTERLTGATMDRVRDGEEALDYLRRKGDDVEAHRPDLVLLDLKLPKVDGHDVLRQIKSDVGLQGIPVAVLTTSQAQSDEAKAYRNHATRFLTKSVAWEGLHEVIRDAVPRQGA